MTSDSVHHDTKEMKKTLPEILAAECGGSPEEYESNLGDMPSLDEAAVSEDEIDMSVDDVPMEFEELDLEQAEEIR